MRALAPILLFTPLLGCFFLSGASALIYEVVWVRQLSLVFGVTIYAISAVLASFMAGLALGSALAGGLADRIRRPALFYALCEIAIAVTGVGSLLAIKQLAPAYVWLSEVAGDGAPIGAVRFVAACAILLLPTGLMGATLPFMVKASLQLLSKVGYNVSLLYALNTAGAAFGVLVAGFFLIGSLGFQASAYVAAALNLAAGLLALSLVPAAQWAARSPLSPSESLQEPEDSDVEETPGTRVAPGWILLVSAISGFCALAYEVIWFRVLDLFLNGTSYAFSIMLVTFLGGLALGSALISLVMPYRWNWAFVLGVLEVLIGLEAIFSIYAVGNVPAWREMLAVGLQAIGLPDRPVVSMTFVAALILLPLTVLCGMTFPVAAQAAAQGRRRVGTLVGGLNASNTVGAILGSLAGGFWIVPQMGSQQGLTLLAIVNISTGIGLAWLALYRVPRLRWALPLAGLAALYPGDAPRMMDTLLSGLFRDHEVLWYEEGLENTVSVQRHPAGYQIMYLNSRDQAFDAPGMARYHQLLGHLPMLLHSNPRDVLVIGLGGGATPGAASRFAGSNVDVVELSPSVVRAAGFFSHINNDVLRQPNVRMILDDGRNFLLLNKKKYDVITADIIQAHHAGSGNLYSREYYELAKSALKEDGVMMQWVNTGQTTLYPMIVRTFLSAFPEATVWSFDRPGSLFIGSKVPQRLSVESLATRLAEPGVREAAAALGLADPVAIMRIYAGDAQTFRQAVGDGPILTDDRPLTEYFRSAPGKEWVPEMSVP